MADDKRTAIVFIHGQGEHRPMKSAEEFARSIQAELGDAELVRAEDTNIDSPESGRVSIHDKQSGETYDLLEYYWSHLKIGSQIGDVWLWFRKLITRDPADVPKQLETPRRMVIELSEIVTIFLAAFMLFTASIFAWKSFGGDFDGLPEELKFTQKCGLFDEIRGMRTAYDVIDVKLKECESIGSRGPVESTEFNMSSADGGDGFEIGYEVSNVVRFPQTGPAQLIGISQDQSEYSWAQDVTVWTSTGDFVVLGSTSDEISAMAFSSDGRKFYTGDDEGTIKVWDINRTPLFPSTEADQTLSLSRIGGSETEYVLHIQPIEGNKIAVLGDEGFSGIIDLTSNGGVRSSSVICFGNPPLYSDFEQGSKIDEKVPTCSEEHLPGGAELENTLTQRAREVRANVKDFEYVTWSASDPLTYEIEYEPTDFDFMSLYGTIRPSQGVESDDLITWLSGGNEAISGLTEATDLIVRVRDPNRLATLQGGVTKTLNTSIFDETNDPDPDRFEPRIDPDTLIGDEVRLIPPEFSLAQTCSWESASIDAVYISDNNYLLICPTFNTDYTPFGIHTCEQTDARETCSRLDAFQPDPLNSPFDLPQAIFESVISLQITSSRYAVLGVDEDGNNWPVVCDFELGAAFAETIYCEPIYWQQDAQEIALSDDGRFLALLFQDGTIKVTELPSRILADSQDNSFREAWPVMEIPAPDIPVNCSIASRWIDLVQHKKPDSPDTERDSCEPSMPIKISYIGNSNLVSFSKDGLFFFHVGDSDLLLNSVRWSKPESVEAIQFNDLVITEVGRDTVFIDGDQVLDIVEADPSFVYYSWDPNSFDDIPEIRAQEFHVSEPVEDPPLRATFWLVIILSAPALIIATLGAATFGGRISRLIANISDRRLVQFIAVTIGWAGTAFTAGYLGILISQGHETNVLLAIFMASSGMAFFLSVVFISMLVGIVMQTPIIGRAMSIIGFLGLMIAIPSLIAFYIGDTLADERLRYEVLRFELLAISAIISLVCIWLRRLLVGMLLVFLALPFAAVEVVRYIAMYGFPQRLDFFYLNYSYFAILVFIAIGLFSIVMNVTSLARFRMSLLAISFALLFVLGIVIEALPDSFQRQDLVAYFNWVSFSPYMVWCFAVLVFSVTTILYGLIAANTFLVPIMADTARYLDDKPRNIRMAREIRERGVRLLEALHTSGRYKRIIVVAHSLGSVVGLDIVSRTWDRLGRARAEEDRQIIALSEQLEGALLEASEQLGKAVNKKRKKGVSVFDSLAVLARALPSLKDKDAHMSTPRSIGNGLSTIGPAALNRLKTYTEALGAQTGGEKYADAIAALTRAVGMYNQLLSHTGPSTNGHDIAPTQSPQWIVSDFITVGSPLNFGPFLIGEARYKPYPKQGTPETEKSMDMQGELPARSIPMRWTNIFFPTRNVLLGDIISGPLWRHFGYGVTDVELSDRKPNGQAFSHNEYWKSKDPEDGAKAHVKPLLAAMGVGSASA